MNKYRRLEIFVVRLMLLAALCTSTSFTLVNTRQAFLPGVVLVGMKDGGERTLSGWLEKEMGARTVERIPAVNALVLQVQPGQERLWMDRLSPRPEVAYVELDYSAHSTDIPADNFSSVVGQIPDDPDWYRQWSLEQINAPLAWGITTGGSDIVVAILDSGVKLDHPDLASKLWWNPGETPGNGIDDDGNGKVDDLNGWHFYHNWNGSEYIPAEDANVLDDYGHGTHVAGIVGAASDNGVGIAGVSWGARLMTVKVLDPYGNGWYSDIATGIIYAVDAGATIVNLSLGGEPDSQLLRDAVDYARERGVLVIAAAGNTGEAVFYPAAYEPVLAVAATDQDDRRPSFSNFGPQVDLAAPGTEIYSTWYRGNYFTKSGTSMAAPHVSGVAALLWSYDPGLLLQELEDTLYLTSKDVAGPGKDPYTGWGRVDAYRALARLAGYPDLWADMDAAALVSPGATFTSTLTVGNNGFGLAEDVWITYTLSTFTGVLSQESWHHETLEVANEIYSYTLPAIAPAPGISLTHAVTITAMNPDANPTDNFYRGQTLSLYQVVLPFVFR